MAFKSIDSLLESSDLEKQKESTTADIYNIFCRKDRLLVNTIQAIDDENVPGRQFILAQSLKALKKSIGEHHGQYHLDRNITMLYDETSEVAKPSY
jgi:hypothetical protein